MHWDQLVILHINVLPDKGDPPQLTQELSWTALYACTQTLTFKDTGSGRAAQSEGAACSIALFQDGRRSSDPEFG